MKTLESILDADFGLDDSEFMAMADDGWVLDNVKELDKDYWFEHCDIDWRFLQEFKRSPDELDQAFLNDTQEHLDWLKEFSKKSTLRSPWFKILACRRMVYYILTRCHANATSIENISDGLFYDSYYKMIPAKITSKKVVIDVVNTRHQKANSLTARFVFIKR